MTDTITTNQFWAVGEEIEDTKAPKGVDIDKVWKTRHKVDILHRDGEELAPPTGLEPVTYGLTVRRSTD